MVTARRLAPEADLLAVFRALQRTFYVDGLDTTSGQVLATVATAALAAQQHEADAAVFLGAWNSQPVIDETAGDFRTARLWGASSFPALALRVGQKLYQVAAGYASADTVAAQIDQTVQRVQVLQIVNSANGAH